MACSTCSCCAAAAQEVGRPAENSRGDQQSDWEQGVRPELPSTDLKVSR